MDKIVDLRDFRQGRNEQVLMNYMTNDMPKEILAATLISCLDTLRQIRDSAESINGRLDRVAPSYIDKLAVDFPIENISDHLQVEAQMANALIDHFIKIIGDAGEPT